MEFSRERPFKNCRLLFQGAVSSINNNAMLIR
jgi:hypothetical protein